jgi:hypothetical protein
VRDAGRTHSGYTRTHDSALRVLYSTHRSPQSLGKNTRVWKRGKRLRHTDTPRAVRGCQRCWVSRRARPRRFLFYLSVTESQRMTLHRSSITVCTPVRAASDAVLPISLSCKAYNDRCECRQLGADVQRAPPCKSARHEDRKRGRSAGKRRLRLAGSPRQLGVQSQPSHGRGGDGCGGGASTGGGAAASTSGAATLSARSSAPASLRDHARHSLDVMKRLRMSCSTERPAMHRAAALIVVACVPAAVA